MPVIPGLPRELRDVPVGPAGPDDPERDAKRAAWADWRQGVIGYRVQRANECAAHPEERALELAKCKASPTYWLAVWGVLYEPRRRKGIRGNETPFVPFARQVELIEFFANCLSREGEGADADGAVSKSRDVGASWCMCAFALWGWLFSEQPWQVRLISRKEDLVESKSPDSLFWKVDFLLHRLPEWMKPAKHEIADVHLNLMNLKTGHGIAGESTTKKAARGGRATWVGYDEAAFIPDFLHTWTGAAAVADSRFAVSSDSIDEGQDFWNLARSEKVTDKPARFAIDWWDHPLHDDKWYEEMRTRYGHDEPGFHREVLRNPFAGSESFVYPESRNMVVSAEYRYDPGLPQYTTIDPGIRDDCALVFLQYDPHAGLYHVIDAYINSGKPADYYGTILTGEPQSGEGWEYDREALRVMAFTRDRPRATVYGDVAGFNREGATMDTFYSRLEKFGIYVVRDRLPDGEVAQSRRMARSFRGRREAMRELFPRLRFANTPGAMRVLEAFEMHRYKAGGDRAAQAEERVPLHDWTSHPVSAVEYFAVNKSMERGVHLAQLQKPAPVSKLNHRSVAKHTVARWESRQNRRAAW